MTAFRLIDLDGDGYINKNDMEKALGFLEEDVYIIWNRFGFPFYKNVILSFRKKYLKTNLCRCFWKDKNDIF